MSGSKRQGVLIAFEGIDGAGKTTQRGIAAAALRSAGRTVVETREPGGSRGGEEIRPLLVEGDPNRWSPATELLLFAAARRDHWERTIKPSLDEGSIVLTDRFVDSTRAYQVAGRGAAPELLETIHRESIGREADLTVILDLDPQTATERGVDETANENRFEKFGEKFQSQLRQAFLDIARKSPERCRVIDAARHPDAVAVDVFSVIGNAISRAIAANR